jgi:gluconate:H+ symporter, GntP family
VPAPMIDSHGLFLLSMALSAIFALILLIVLGKLNPFLSILVTSLGLGVAAGMPFQTIVKSFELGLGNTLGHIAVIVALGTMLGKMMAESGGADRIAHTLINVFGEKKVHWAMMVIGLVVGLPVFFEVAFVLLIPIVFTVVRRTGKSVVLIGLPMLAGISVVHGLVPPHPAALLAVTIYNADIGRTVFYALLVGIPTAALAGPIYAKFISKRIQVEGHNPIAEQFTDHGDEQNLPGFGPTIATILLPVVLMLLGSWADNMAVQGTLVNRGLHFLGDPDMALLLGVLVSFWTLGKLRGFTKETVLKFTNECLAPTAVVTLLVGAGGGFGRILQDSGVSHAMIQAALHVHISILLLGWLIAALIRLATGSATVALSTAAGIVAPISQHIPGVHPELLAIATGGGSLIFSHVNDGCFWLVKEYFNMSVEQTIKTWSICETIISITSLLLALGLSFAL